MDFRELKERYRQENALRPWNNAYCANYGSGPLCMVSRCKDTHETAESPFLMKQYYVGDRWSAGHRMLGATIHDYEKVAAYVSQHNSTHTEEQAVSFGLYCIGAGPGWTAYEFWKGEK